MNRKRVTFVLLIIGLISGGYILWRKTSPYEHAPGRDVALEVFGGQNELADFLSSSNATVQRIHPHRESQDYPSVLSGLGYDYDASIPATSAQCETFKRLLQNQSSYVWDSAKACMPLYGMLVHFNSTNGTINVAFCFDCKELLVFKSDTNSAKALNIEGDFDPINKQLVAIAKSIFPNDSEIQKLK